MSESTTKVPTQYLMIAISVLIGMMSWALLKLIALAETLARVEGLVMIFHGG